MTSAALMRGFWRIDCGMEARQVGQEVLLCCTHLVKQPRQKLCWQGACRRRRETERGFERMRRRRRRPQRLAP